MSLTVFVNGRNVRDMLNDALVAANGWSGGVDASDLLSLDLNAVLVPSTRYPPDAIPQNTQHTSESTIYAVADVQALDADAVVAALVTARSAI